MWRDEYFNYSSKYRENLIKASVGRYLGELLDDIEGVSMFKIVSTHDNSVAPLVGAMITQEEAETI